MTPYDSHATDKKTLRETIERVETFRREIDCGDPTHWIADSSLYTAENWVKMRHVRWVSRAPETLSEAKALIGEPADAIAWTAQENGYRTAAFHSHNAGIGQRCALVYSEQAYQREKKTLDKQADELKSTLWRLSNAVFGCEQDAQKAFEQRQKTYPLFTLTARIVTIEKYAQRGRPAANREKRCIGHRLETTAVRNDAAIAQRLNAKGRFILATNDLDKNDYPDERILADHKAQQTVEGGFRFLKNPEFIADTFFLKSPKRIGALMMIMTLCLLVYAIAQHRLRQKLKTTNDALPNQLGKPYQTPTLRWIFQLMEGIALVRFLDKARTRPHTSGGQSRRSCAEKSSVSSERTPAGFIKSRRWVAECRL
jgi:transposase